MLNQMVNVAGATIAAQRAQYLMRAGLAAIIVLQIATHLLAFSISAHSGQMAIPYLMNNGRTLFGDVLEQHAPATSVIAALAQRLIPLEPLLVTRGLHLLVVSALTILSYGIAARLSVHGKLAGLLAAAALFWWMPVFGNILFYFDTLLGLFVCLGIFLLLTAQESWQRALLAGLSFGVATLAKQHGWAAVIVAVAWVLLTFRRGRAAFMIGVVTLPALAIAITVANGTLANYIYWNWTFNLTGIMPGELPVGDFVRKVTLMNMFVPPFLLAGLLFRRREWLLIGAVGLAAMASMVPRFGIIHVTAHLPITMIMTGVLLAEFIGGRSLIHLADWLRAESRRWLVAGLLFAVLIAWGWTGAAPYFPTAMSRGSVPAHDEFAAVTAVLVPRHSGEQM
jgi:hypothetical protein